VLATESAELLAEVAPHDAGRGSMLIGEILESVGDSAGARTHYEDAVRLLEAGSGRYLTEAYRKLATLHEAEGRPDEALAVLKKAMAVQPAGPGVAVV
jgi:Flp pilus assembly protein TadD